MNLYDEFFSIIEAFEENNITYAVIGGVALAFHDKPRLTRDIDILIENEHLEIAEQALIQLDYFKSTDPHRFLNVNLVLHRFIKTKDRDHLVVGILTGEEDEFKNVFKNAIRADRKGGKVAIASKKDLIRLKEFRNSDQDKTDIKKLSSDDQD